jgi:hypothetical protein
MSQRQQAALAPRLTSSEMDAMANKEGSRRTIYFTKKLPGNGGYRRTGQYLGEWKNNAWEGKGTHEMANGSRYVGAWSEGKRNGMGTLWVMRKGKLRKQYAGQWSNNQQHGRGVFHYENGDHFNGEWKNGARHGVGIMTYKCGDVYEGEWFNDQRHGFGVLDYAKGDHFEGMWVEDKKEGEGVHFYFHQEKATHTRRYDGEWVNDVPRCGYYSEMPPDPLVPASGVPDALPSGTVIDSRGIIASRLAEIREERKHHRATRCGSPPAPLGPGPSGHAPQLAPPRHGRARRRRRAPLTASRARRRVPLDEHFTSEELEALQVAFNRIDVDGTGTITLAQLPAAFTQVGMEISEEEMGEVLAYLHKSGSPDDPFTFAEFSQAADYLSPVPQE